MRLNLLAAPVLLATFALGFVGCAAYSTKEAGPKEAGTAQPSVSQTSVTQAAAEQAISSARAAIAESSKITNGWTTTDDLIKAAEEALGKGDYAKVVDLAAKAKSQAESAVAQARSEKARLN